MAAGLAQQFARLVHIRGTAGEGDGEIIRLHLRGRLDIGPVLVGERLGRQATALAVDALVVGQLTTDDHPTFDLAAAYFLDPQHQRTVIQQQGVTAIHIIGQ